MLFTKGRRRRAADHARLELAEKFKISNVDAPSGWSIGLDDAVILLTEAERYLQRSHISYLEFGYGLSTRILEQYLTRQFRSYRMLSLEGDADYHRGAMSWRSGRVLNSEQIVDIRHVPYDGATGIFSTNETRAILSEAAPDLVFVDAPPDTNAQDARLRTIEEILPFLSKKSIVVIHDTKRVDELFAFATLRERFVDNSFYNTPKGIAVLRFPKDGA